MTIPTTANLRNIGFVLAIILSGTAGFGLGMLVESQNEAKGQVSISQIPTTPGLPAEASSTHAIPSGGEVVGSRSTKKYYLPWCPGATNLKKVDTVWFASEDDAQSDGYVAGGKCPGI